MPIKELSGSSQGFHVLINRDHGHARYRVDILREAIGDWLCAKLRKDGLIGWIPTKEGEPTEPFITIDAKEFPIFEALADAIREAGIVPKNESRMEGILQAKDDHLQDLRRMLNLDAPRLVLGKQQEQTIPE